MSENKSERVKIYLIIGLSIVLMVVVYFRFFHKKATHAAAPAQYKASLARLPVPQVQLPTLQGGRQPEKALDESRRSIPRDIFEPIKAPPPKKETQPHTQKPPRPAVSLELKGTIIGGENAIAVINDRFVHTGDKIGEYQVVTISKEEVILTSDTHNMGLKVLKIAEK